MLSKQSETKRDQNIFYLFAGIALGHDAMKGTRCPVAFFNRFANDIDSTVESQQTRFIAATRH